MTGTVVTFYSYKGGTGRTMALANIGWILASNGERVLVIDWDLEAPGLHLYFQRFLSPDTRSPRRGLIEYFWDLAAFAADPQADDPSDQAPAAPSLLDHAERISYPFQGEGRIDLIRAGRQDQLFSQRVQDFEWKRFYEDLDGESLLQLVRDDLKDNYSWILIDSRTGLSDTSGICTVVMPDVLVNCFVPNQQSIDGAQAVADSVVAQRQESIRIFPLPCRIENAEHEKLEKARSTWRRKHQRFLPTSLDPENYWGTVEIPYRANYAFDESLAPLTDRPGQVDTVLAACERFTWFMTDEAVRDFRPPPSARRAGGAPRVFISYAHDDAAHVDQVRGFWLFLRSYGIDARLDLPAAEQRLDWVAWLTREVREADQILVVASPAYQRSAAGEPPGEGTGVQREARLIREVLYAEQGPGPTRVVPVVLPGGSVADLPPWLGVTGAPSYTVTEFSVAGAEGLLRLLTGQPPELDPSLGPVPVLPGRAQDAVAARSPRTEVTIEASLSATGVLRTVTDLAGSPLPPRQARLPLQVADVWNSLRLPPGVAAERMADAGRRLAGALLDDAGRRVLGSLLRQLGPGASAEVTLAAEGSALALPVELIRLPADDGNETGPVGLLPGVAVVRRVAGPATGAVPAATAGPLKVLVAVAAPDETKVSAAPLDIEAEMGAVLDAVSGVVGESSAQVRILEVASLSAIRQALSQDSYHVLHLSARGSAEAVELEDEDGAPVMVTHEGLMRALAVQGQPVPLIVLLSGADGAGGADGADGAGGSLWVAAGLLRNGADRVIATIAPATDSYATAVARNLYRTLARTPALPVGQALARARYETDVERRSEGDVDRVPPPEYGLATLLASRGDGPLVDQSAPAVPLSVATSRPSGQGVLELPAGALIGRRAQLRTVIGVLRRDPAAVSRFGAVSGVVLTGIAGIGKTALAGRVIARLRDEGWLVAVHEGRWNPTALIMAVTGALADGAARGFAPARAAVLDHARELLADSSLDDGPKLAVVARLLEAGRLLVVFDDYEQNLSPGGLEFTDPAADDALTLLADAARDGGLLVTCRYPLPGPDRFLAEVPVPALSAAELRRMFLRLPALAELDADDQRLLTRVIGGHPRLIEFTDALLRGGRSSLRHVQLRLRDLAARQGVDLRQARPLTEAVDQAMMLGSADILLSGLLDLLTPGQAAILAQVTVCRAPMTVDDLAFALGDSVGPPDPAQLRADVARLTDLTLLAPGSDVTMHPWTSEMVSHASSADPGPRHERALAMRLRRFEQGRGTYDDLLDIPRHLAFLGRYDDVAVLAEQAVRLLPGTLATSAYLAEVSPLIPPAQRAWILVADLEVQSLLSAGNLPGATRLLRALHEQAEANAAADPANTEWQRDLSVSHSRLAEVAIATGDLATARTHYEASLGIRERLSAADPANVQWQRDLSVARNGLGDIAMATGDLGMARAHRQAALRISERLAAADPANTAWQRDLAAALNGLGDLALADGDPAAAEAAYAASLVIGERLAAADPANPQWQRDLSIAHNKLGDSLVAGGSRMAARAHQFAALDINQRLAAADPANTVWQRDLSIAHNKLGDTAMATGDPETARTHYQAGLDSRLRLVAADPANTQWQLDLSVSHAKLGDVAARAGDLGAARSGYQAALDIRARLVAADPANTQWQDDLAAVRERLGAVAADQVPGTLVADRPEQPQAAVQDSFDPADDEQPDAASAITGW